MSELLSKLENLATRDNITLAIAIFGAVGTIATWITTALHSRKHIAVHIVKAYQYNNKLILYLSFQNKSRLPISIDSITLVTEDSNYFCNTIQHIIFTITPKTGKTIAGKSDITSILFPINLSSLGGASGYVEFDFPQEASKRLSTHLNLQVQTNRGALPKMQLPFGGFSNLEELL